MYGSLYELFYAMDGDKNRLIDTLLDEEMERSAENETQVAIRLVEQWQAMRTSALQALSDSMRFQAKSVTNNIPGLPHFIQEGYNDKSVLNTMKMALLYDPPDHIGGNFLFIPGAEAVLAATLVTAIDGTEVTSNQLFSALFIARGVGRYLARKQKPAGKDCRYECALNAAPAAAALTTLSGDSARTIENAVGISMARCEKYQCLPVGEMVQLPCVSRNAAQALNALISTDFALGGHIAGESPDSIMQRLCAM